MRYKSREWEERRGGFGPPVAFGGREGFEDHVEQAKGVPSSVGNVQKALLHLHITPPLSSSSSTTQQQASKVRLENCSDFAIVVVDRVNETLYLLERILY